MGTLAQLVASTMNDPDDVRLATDYTDGGFPVVTIPLTSAATDPTPADTLQYDEPTASIDYIDWSAGGNYGAQGRPGPAKRFGWRTGFVSPEARNRPFDGQRINGPGPAAGMAVIGQVGQQNLSGQRLALAQAVAAAGFPSTDEIAASYTRGL